LWILGAVGLVVVGGGCSAASATCPGNCADPPPAVLDLSCGPTDLQSVVLSGPCAKGYDDATAPSQFVSGARQQLVDIPSLFAGTCHVELTFASGYTFATQIEFTYQPGNAQDCTCGTNQANPAMITVPNPSATCLGEAGAGD